MLYWAGKQGGEKMAKTAAVSHQRTLDLIYIALFAVLLALCSWVCLPLPVPFTLQTLGVFLSVGLLGGRRGTAAILVYLLLGLVGLPVFAGFGAGPGVLLGPLGGYLLGFVLTALIMWLFAALLGNSQTVLALSMLLGMLAYFTLGTLWFALVSGSGLSGLGAALSLCVFPFILPDLAKIGLALFLIRRLRGAVRD